MTEDISPEELDEIRRQERKQKERDKFKAKNEARKNAKALCNDYRAFVAARKWRQNATAVAGAFGAKEFNTMWEYCIVGTLGTSRKGLKK